MAERATTVRGWARAALAGPGAILVSVAVMGGMTRWLPAGAAGIDNLVLPLVLAPLIWAALFFHACLDRRLARVAIVSLLLLAGHVALMAGESGVRAAPAGIPAR